MERRDFMTTAGCGMTALVGLSHAVSGQQLPGTEMVTAPVKPKRYRLEIEIYEARTDSWCHKKGDKFAYPADLGKICPWLRASLDPFLLLLFSGCRLGWKYEGTPYEKIIDQNGVTTEYVRCPDPTANLVAKITRTEMT